MQKDIQISLEASRQMVEQCLADQDLQAALVKAVNCCVNALKSGGKLMFAGNGGSAAEAQHFSAEMVGRFLTERKPLASVALSTDTSALTAIGNDYGYDQVFSRQVEALGRSGDVSGRSKNILAAIRAAAALGVATIAFTGREPREIGALADVVLNVPSSHTPQIQEGHLILGHLLCGLVETQFTS